jgi:hypothetical protein
VRLRVQPASLKEANAFVAAHHRHCKPARGHKFSLSALMGDELLGVAIVGRTVARMLHDPMTAEVVRVAVKDGAPKGTGSFLYGACRRVWQTMGGLKLLTYTLDEESGATLRGAGWEPVASVPARAPGRNWNAEGRPRDWDEIYGKPKTRWEALLDSRASDTTAK